MRLTDRQIARIESTILRAIGSTRSDALRPYVSTRFQRIGRNLDCTVEVTGLGFIASSVTIWTRAGALKVRNSLLPKQTATLPLSIEGKSVRNIVVLRYLQACLRPFFEAHDEDFRINGQLRACLPQYVVRGGITETGTDVVMTVVVPTTDFDFFTARLKGAFAGTPEPPRTTQVERPSVWDHLLSEE